jgi:ribosome-binding factor A
MSKRREQIASAIQGSLGRALQREIRDPRLGFVTITRVEVTPDMKLAKVYFSVIGSEEDRKNSHKVLKGAANFLRRELASDLNMRYTPILMFFFDEAMEHGEKIQRILHELEEEEKNRPPQTPDQTTEG